MRRTIQRALLIIAAGAALGLLANGVSPRRIPYLTPPKPPLQPGEIIALAEAESLWNSGAAIFLDARPPADYAAGHIANAFNLPVDEFQQHYPQVAALLGPDTPVVAYCDGIECELSHRLAQKLRELGHTNVRVLLNGWTVWRQAGLPTATGQSP
jgi:rhodanese-related sulfurtransferase